ncbi:MAG: hypothetical protein ACRC1K_12685 [Planctomycetia bacterium]
MRRVRRGRREVAARLGVADPAAVTVPADGAKWIWRQAERQFPGSRGVLDVFHALEPLAAARSVYCEGSGAALGWKTIGLLAQRVSGWVLHTPDHETASDESQLQRPPHPPTPYCVRTPHGSGD